ncbi:PAN domain-containing protein [Toxoplasma gondii TgCatPRC2]|uniref:PAN domain-containing protein n=4 Tax=Toxoplasma gondii TaxID=5811 RepID=A0A151H4P4_TOXGO|nr:PAN domain-containing protein [Toxoplasma gondii ME49]EPT26742.1 PAN domain-containing protein [Toxoplasma gondii ME49]KFG31474.1 PAN domain-containing protein [Toxoplasma gondii GAB2-2007-GAL-DOM2]KYF38739.1 PAN domain-containing protein [Toxoplasma gondii ARI]KYK64309.1 PAN domain-containing protein [Toxoplasma gondii TgCatPRC2]|eukprot:XP_018635828.1 PAN domain-containing protein [Toxoplasma gondii ME49]
MGRIGRIAACLALAEVGRSCLGAGPGHKSVESFTVAEAAAPVPVDAKLAWCYELNVDFRSHDVEKVEDAGIATPNLCQAMCAVSPSCYYWTWVPQTGSCYLKDQLAPQNRVQDDTAKGMVSGPKTCGPSPTICLEYGVDYVGYDIEKVETGGVQYAQECQRLCYEKEGCYFFSWVSETRNCYLKGPAALTGRKLDSTTVGIVSGPKTCGSIIQPLPPSSGSCYESGVDYTGFDVEKLETTSKISPQHCQMACFQHAQCFYWTWTPTSEGNFCYLKSNLAPIGKRRTPETQSFVSGPKRCPSSGSTQTCFENDFDYYGNDIEKIEDGSIQSDIACQQACAHLKGCAFFTFSRQQKWCYLKSYKALAGRRASSVTGDLVSGPAHCSYFQNPDTSLNCYEQDVDLVGSTLKVVSIGRVTSPVMCQQLCGLWGMCMYFTWSSLDKSCALKTGTALHGWKKDETTKGLVSGPKKCGESQVPCQEAGVSYPGYNIMRITSGHVRSPAMCQKLCQTTPGCRYWTWQPTDNACELKGRAALTGRQQNDETRQMISGPKFCSAVTAGCYEVDVDYWGNDIQKLEDELVASPSICQGYCQRRTDCRFWTWVSATQSCYLKNVNGVYGRRRDSTTGGMVSGPAFCPQQPQCFEDSVDYTGYDLEKVETGKITTPAMCQTLCQQRDLCRYWSWVSHTKNCYLKGQFALMGRRDDSSTSGIVSGPQYCTTTPTECHEYGYDYSGHDVTKIVSGSVKSPNTCETLCEHEPDCFFWTWDRKENNCYLKDQYAPHGRIQDSRTVSLISGGLGSSNTFKGRFSDACVEDEVAYAGYDLPTSATVVGTSLGNVRGKQNGSFVCQTMCRATQSCFYWSYDQAANRCFLKNQYALQGRVRNESTKNFVSGSRDCVPKPSQCHELDVDYRGYDLKKIETQQIQSYHVCQEICRVTDGCHYWTWSSQTFNCYLKTDHAFSTRVEDQFSVGLVSGPKRCAPAGASCWEYGVDFYGYDIQKIEDGSVISAALCQGLCKQKPLCDYWTWNSETNSCYLKNSSAPLGRLQDLSTAGMISGPRECPATQPDCRELNIDYYGNDVHKYEDGDVTTANECQWLCQNKADCFFWTYLTEQRFCYLKNYAAAGTRVPHNDAISGPKNCLTTTTGDIGNSSTGTCFEHDIQYVAPALPHSARVTGPEGCQALCQAEPLCTVFEFYVHSERCIMKDLSQLSPLDPVYKRTVPGIISGPRECPTTVTTAPPVSSGCFQVGIEYIGHDLTQENSVLPTATSAATCQAFCAAAANCKYWTYVAATSQCTLKDEHANANSMSNAYAVSGPKTCASAA